MTFFLVPHRLPHTVNMVDLRMKSSIISSHQPIIVAVWLTVLKRLEWEITVCRYLSFLLKHFFHFLVRAWYVTNTHSVRPLWDFNVVIISPLRLPFQMQPKHSLKTPTPFKLPSTVLIQSQQLASFFRPSDFQQQLTKREKHWQPLIWAKVSRHL